MDKIRRHSEGKGTAKKYWIYWFGIARDHTDQMGLSYSNLVHWSEATEMPVLPKRPGKFDSRVVEPGLPPILTADGIVLIYNGADQLVYRTGIAVFDRQDPRKVLYSDKPLFAPELVWEKVGQVANVVFVERLVARRDRHLLYYCGAYKYIGVAATNALYTK